MDQILRVVAMKGGVTVDDLRSDRRDKKTVKYRQIAYYLCSSITLRSSGAIGRALRKDDSTVRYSVIKLGQELEWRPASALSKEIREIARWLEPS